MKKRTCKILGIVFSLLFVFFYCTFPFQEVENLPDEIIISYNDIDYITKNKKYNLGTEIQIDAEIENSGEKRGKGKLIYKLFNFLPIKKVNVKVAPARKVYSGGDPIGFQLQSDGVIVIMQGDIITDYGFTKINNELNKGDVIKKINNKRILTTSDIYDVLNKAQKEKSKILLEYDHEGKTYTTEYLPIKDKNTGKYKLGLWVKDNTAGLGTLSYVKLDKRFGALGHNVTEQDTGITFPLNDGQMYNAKIISVNKGRSGYTGSLLGAFNNKSQAIGKVDKNCKYGVFGKLNNIPKSNKIIEVGSRLGVRMGKAQILTTVDDKKDLYDVEIIKATSQKNPNTKSMVIRITDKNLIQKTGGIVQGMSGSPIIQDGKIIGALTHVFVNDPKKGYGIYLDWMYDL